MKNFFARTLLQSGVCLTLGVLIIIYSDMMPTWLVQAVGVGFLFPGLYAIVSYFLSKRDAAPLPPLLVYTGLGTLLLGLVMFLHPDFVHTFDYEYRCRDDDAGRDDANLRLERSA